MRLIDGDALIERVECETRHYVVRDDFDKGRIAGWNNIIKAVRDYIPTVDAVSVVRCRECKYHNKPRLGFCEMHLVRMNENDFCSYGERKGGNE